MAGPVMERITGRRWNAAAAAAPPKPPVLWQLMQSCEDELPWWLPTVAVLRLVPYHFWPEGPWQLLQVGVDEPLLPLVKVMNWPEVWFVLVPEKDVKTEVEWHISQPEFVAPAMGMCRGDIVTPPVVLSVVARLVTPYQLMLAVWQLAHPVVMLVCTIAVPGPKALVERWQTLQSSAEGRGRWPPVVPTAGEATIWRGWKFVPVVPSKAPPLVPEGVNFAPDQSFAPALWQDAQVPVTAVWGMGSTTLVVEVVWQVEQTAVPEMAMWAEGRAEPLAKGGVVVWQPAQSPVASAPVECGVSFWVESVAPEAVKLKPEFAP